MISQLSKVSEHERGKIFEIDGYKLVYRYAGTVSGDHQHDVDELLYLVHGEAELEVDGKVIELRAPVRVDLAAGMHHTLVAKSDIVFLEQR